MRRNYLIISVFFILAISGCAEADFLPEVDPQEITRKVGPEGGTITFYSESLPQDLEAAARKLATLEIPPNALTEDVIFSIENDGTSSNPLWRIDPSVDFSSAVSLSYRVAVLDSTNSDAHCYYRPNLINLNSDTVEIQDFEYDPVENFVSMSINQLDGSQFTYLQSVDFPYQTSNYFFCSESNPEFLEIDLSSGSVAGSDLLIIPEGAIQPPGFISVEPIAEYPERDILIGSYRHTNDEIEIGTITAVPTNNFFGDIYSISMDNFDPDTSATLYLRLLDDFPYNVPEQLESLSFYKVDIENNLVEEQLDLELERSEPYIFRTQVTSGGTYVVGTPTEDFELWLGGDAQVTLTSSTETILVDFNSNDHLGIEVFCLEAGSSFDCLFPIRLNKQSGDKEDAEEYMELEFYYYSPLDYLEIFSSAKKEIVFDHEGSLKTITLDAFGVDSYHFSNLDTFIGGVVSGSFTTGGEDEENVYYTVTIDFNFKVFKSYVE